MVVCGWCACVCVRMCGCVCRKDGLSCALVKKKASVCIHQCLTTRWHFCVLGCVCVASGCVVCVWLCVIGLRVCGCSCACERVRACVCALAQAMVKPPGGREKPWHQDAGVYSSACNNRSFSSRRSTFVLLLAVVPRPCYSMRPSFCLACSRFR